jgi:hypothetical protein
MGTRNSTLVKIEGEYRIAQYCQLDGRPEHLGVSLFNLLKDVDQELLKKKIFTVKSIPYESVKEKWIECGGDGSGWVTPTVSEIFKSKYPHLHRDCNGADVLYLIMKDKTKEVCLDVDFPKDSLFCEWCYVIDFDKGTFEVLKGFNREKLNEDERFYEEPNPESVYYPVKLLKEFNLSNLPETSSMFLLEVEKEHETLLNKLEWELKSIDPES